MHTQLQMRVQSYRHTSLCEVLKSELITAAKNNQNIEISNKLLSNIFNNNHKENVRKRALVSFWLSLVKLKGACSAMFRHKSIDYLFRECMDFLHISLHFYSHTIPLDNASLPPCIRYKFGCST